GLDVQFEPMQNGSVVSAAVVGGSLEIGYANMLDLMVAHTRGLPLLMVAPGGVYTTKSPDPVLLVLKDSAARTARDFNGKIIGTNQLKNLASTIFLAWMEKNG